jgi:xanthine dehydrogenase YagR molybdenum-binding subunit
VANEQVPNQPAPAVPTPHKEFPWPEKPAVIGTRVKRLDAPEKATGRAKYTYDINRPGMIYGKILRSPYAHAKIVSIDLSAAAKAPGVKATLAVLEPGKRAFYQGDEIAAVAAVTEDQAEDAIGLIKVEYEELEHAATEEQAMAPDAPKILDAGNVTAPRVQEQGNLAEGFAKAARTVEQTYNTQVITHTCLETHGTVCEWEGDKLTAWVSTQAVHGTRDQFAQNLGIPQANVRVITQYMGGGFGSKFGPDPQGIICAKLAKQAGVPVKLMLDRKEEHLATGNRPSAWAKIKAGVSADGMITAFDAESWGTGGYSGRGAAFPIPYIYVVPNFRVSHKDVAINAGNQRAMRAPAQPQACFVTEVLVDELADAVKMDPLELRMKNLPPDGPSSRWRTYYPIGAQKFAWNRRHPTGDPTPGPIKRGMGCAANRWAGGGRAGKAHIEIHADGGVVVQAGTQDLGTGTRTIVAIVAAETLGLPVSAIKPDIGDTNYPLCGGSGGSTTAAGVTPAVRIGCGRAVKALAARVAPSLGVDAATLVASNGRIHVKDNPSKGLAWKDACKLLGTEPISAEGEWEPGLSASGTSGIQFVDVEVDTETGITKVKKVVVVQDCGLILDRLTAESQVNGGVIGSINYALFEDRILDRRTAQMVNPNMEFYLVAGPSDVPEIDITLVDQPERGVVGLGEPPTVSTSAAIANAVSNAIGARIRSLPITPKAVLEAIERAKSGGTL